MRKSEVKETKPKKTKKTIPTGHVDVHITVPEAVHVAIEALGREESSDPADLAIRALSTTRKYSYLLSTHPRLAAK